ncbi:MAG: hypothetical protein ACE5EQ_06790, partial [Phycisphaerae bacterium]
CSVPVTFQDSAPPEITCSVMPVPEDDDDESGDGGGEEGDDKDNSDHEKADEGLRVVLFEASATCGTVSVRGVIDIGCEVIPVDSGTFIKLKCKDKCKKKEDDGILKIETTSATLVVTAVDECGNEATCESVLCTPSDDSDDEKDEDDSEDENDRVSIDDASGQSIDMKVLGSGKACGAGIPLSMGLISILGLVGMKRRY